MVKRMTLRYKTRNRLNFTCDSLTLNIIIINENEITTPPPKKTKQTNKQTQKQVDINWWPFINNINCIAFKLSNYLFQKITINFCKFGGFFFWFKY